MAVAASSLSIAVQGIAEYLDSQFGEEVNITVTNPQKASESVKGAGSTAHCLNLFAYRIAPAGFAPDIGSDQTHYIRLNLLLTPFPADITDAADDADLRILGHAIRVLQSNPVLPLFPATLPGGALIEPVTHQDYRMEVIMLAPSMEEINHIWTTQGGELAYRLSAAYEFALIPIEPLEPRTEISPPSTLVIDSHNDMTGASQPFNGVSNDSVAQPLGDSSTVNWLPMQMGIVGQALSNNLDITQASTAVTIAIIGPPGESAAVLVIWTLIDQSLQTQAAQIKLIAATRFDDQAAQTSISLSVPANAVEGHLRVQPALGGVPVPDSAFGNVITLSLA